MTISSKPVIAIARQAGEAIIQHLQPGLEVIVKADESPVTQADLAAHTIVMHGLAGIDPAIPIMSEEGTPEEKQAAHRSHRRWIVDPLDGSKTSIEYAKGKLDEDGFGVHIALIEDDIPVLGVAYFPAKGNGGVLYYTGDDGRAYRQEGTEAPKRIRTSGLPMSEPLKAAVSWREDQRPDNIAGRAVEHVPEVGGGRICITAEGTTDIAHVDKHFSHWDVAAAHAILRAAGGELVNTETGKPIRYDNPGLYVEPCIGANTDKLKFLGLGEHLPHTGRQHGFTLVELAIVLVIIGLIIGAVLAGATLIRNAEMNAVISEKTRYETAMSTFRLRYNAMPGDMPNATGLWGARDTDQMTCFSTPTDGTETCNGNGDKRVWDLVPFSGQSGVTQMTQIMEALLVWQHLSNAELIPANLNGNIGAGSGFLNTEIGTNIPNSKIGEAGWFTMYISNMTPAFAAANCPHIFPGSYGQFLVVGSIRIAPFEGAMPFGPLFTTAETMGLDKKIDDGRPASGIMRSLAPAPGTPFENTCATSSDPATAEYTVVGGNECVMGFKLKI